MTLRTEIINDLVTEDSDENRESLERTISTLRSAPFNCKQPLLAIEMIKRRIRVGAGMLITREDIIRWGNR